MITYLRSSCLLNKVSLLGISFRTFSVRSIWQNFDQDLTQHLLMWIWDIVPKISFFWYYCRICEKNLFQDKSNLFLIITTWEQVHEESEGNVFVIFFTGLPLSSSFFANWFGFMGNGFLYLWFGDRHYHHNNSLCDHGKWKGRLETRGRWWRRRESELQQSAWYVLFTVKLRKPWAPEIHVWLECLFCLVCHGCFLLYSWAMSKQNSVNLHLVEMLIIKFVEINNYLLTHC